MENEEIDAVIKEATELLGKDNDTKEEDTKGKGDKTIEEDDSIENYDKKSYADITDFDEMEVLEL